MYTVHHISREDIKRINIKMDWITDRTYSDLSDDEAMLEYCWSICSRTDTTRAVLTYGAGNEYIGSVFFNLFSDKIRLQSEIVFDNKEDEKEFLSTVWDLWVKSPEYIKHKESERIVLERVEKVGGMDKWRSLSAEANRKFTAKKIEVVKKYITDFERSKEMSREERKLLSEKLKNEGVFRNNAYCISGLDHMEYIYETQVKGR